MAALTKEEKLKKLNEVQSSTIAAVFHRLATPDGDAIVIRPTGFGKTHTINRIARIEKNGKRIFQKVLYVYPGEVIKSQIMEQYGEDSHVEFLTYTFFSLVKDGLSTKEAQRNFKLAHGEVDLIILDEAHKAGAENALKGLKGLFKMYPSAKKIAITATYNRSDGVDVCTELFHKNSFIHPYTLKDAINDGIMEKLHYVTISFSYLEKAGKIIKAIEENANIDDAVRKEVEQIKRDFFLNSECINMHQLIRKNVNRVYGNTPEYLKFVVFFSRIEDIYAKKDEVEAWFRLAYPGYKVSSLIVASDTVENRNNVNMLQSMRHRKNNIDLIFNVNMVTLGYHVDDITGAIMMRHTKSETVYQQQLGRCMSVTKMKSPIIFDMVDNYQMEPAFISVTRSKTNSSNNVVDADFIDLNCVECSDELVEQTELLNRLSTLSSKDKIEQAVWNVINMNMHITKAAKMMGVRHEYVYNEIAHRIEEDTLTIEKTELLGQFAGVGKGGITPVKKVVKLDMTLEELAKRFEREQQEDSKEQSEE